MLKLMRIKQWYKNLLIFIPLFFARKLFEFDSTVACVVGFVSLCLISSAFYVVNDIKDIKADRVHPEKRYRPLSSGRVSVFEAVWLSVLLFCGALLLASYLSFPFIIFPLLLFMFSLFYTLVVKNIAIADIHFISFNYIIRAVSGVVLISTPLSSWFILFIYVGALFLATGKRRADLELLGDDAKLHKSVYRVYNKKFLDWLSMCLLTVMLFSYILYSFMAHEGSYMMVTIPFVSFIIIRYLFFISINHELARQPEYFFRDPPLVTGALFWGLACFVILYLL